MIWIQPKRFGPNQNKLYPSKTIWAVKNNFGLQKDKAKDYCSMKGYDSKVQNCPNLKLLLAKV